MIINFLLNILVAIFGTLFIFLPNVTLADLPFIGELVQSTLTTAILTYNAFIVTFPYAEIAMHTLLYIIMPFEVLLIIARFFLGSRTPVNTN